MQTFSPLPDWLQLEHDVAEIFAEQYKHGWSFDVTKAQQLEQTLRSEMEELDRVLRKQFPFVAGTLYVPKRSNRTQGYIEGCEIQRIKETNFTSRDHIAWILQTHLGQKLQQLTMNGKPEISEVTLQEMNSPFSNKCARILALKKQLGMLSEGVNAYLKLCTIAERLHHTCAVTCATHRTSANKPNLQQVPSDKAFRELFRATPGQCLVSADLSGIELRMLSHYLTRYDGGRYRDILLNGDIHQTNADAIGVSRRLVKTISYAIIYGASFQKLGHTYDQSLSIDKAKTKGKEIKEAFIAAIPGFAELLAQVRQKSMQGYIKAIDGRKIYVDSPHKGLNFLLQSSSGVLARRWMLLANKSIKEVGIRAHQLAFVHDEINFECEEKYINDLKFTLEHSAAEAGEYYGLRCPITAEAKSGINWSEVH